MWESTYHALELVEYGSVPSLSMMDGNGLEYKQRLFMDGMHINSYFSRPHLAISSLGPSRIYIQNPPPDDNNFSVNGLSFKLQSNNTCIVGDFTNSQNEKKYAFEYTIIERTADQIHLQKKYGAPFIVVDSDSELSA